MGDRICLLFVLKGVAVALEVDELESEVFFRVLYIPLTYGWTHRAEAGKVPFCFSSSLEQGFLFAS